MQFITWATTRVTIFVKQGINKIFFEITIQNKICYWKNAESSSSLQRLNTFLWSENVGHGPWNWFLDQKEIDQIKRLIATDFSRDSFNVVYTVKNWCDWFTGCLSRFISWNVKVGILSIQVGNVNIKQLVLVWACQPECNDCRPVHRVFNLPTSCERSTASTCQGLLISCKLGCLLAVFWWEKCQHCMTSDFTE